MNNQTLKIASIERKIRLLIWVFIVGLVVSGLTAFPLEWELSISNEWVTKNLPEDNALRYWIAKVYYGVQDTYHQYPFIGYGTDWLAFAHIIIALNFLGPLKDPVKNIWVIEFGMLACILVIPLALVAGIVREIPFYWRVIDCSFGLVGILPLTYTHQLIRQLKKLKDENQ